MKEKDNISYEKLEDSLDNWKHLSFLLCMAAIGLFIGICFVSNNIDPKILGTYMCEHNNATFERVETNMAAGIAMDNMHRFYLKIYCVPKDYTPIEDGYLLIRGQEKKEEEKFHWDTVDCTKCNLWDMSEKK